MEETETLVHKCTDDNKDDEEADDAPNYN